MPWLLEPERRGDSPQGVRELLRDNPYVFVDEEVRRGGRSGRNTRSQVYAYADRVPSPAPSLSPTGRVTTGDSLVGWWSASVTYA